MPINEASAKKDTPGGGAPREYDGADGERWSANYADPAHGVSSSDLVQLALQSNAELAAARLDLERGRARLRQAGLRPNPTVDFEYGTGRLIGSPGERGATVGFAMPLELGGQRGRRIELAEVELAATEAEIADRERRLIGEVRTAYAEALAALRELRTTEDLNNLDLQTARVVEARFTEGESSKLELNLLRVEVERLRARRAFVEGKLQAAALNLKRLTGMAPDESLRLREDLSEPGLPEPAPSLATAIELALRQRPDLKLAQLNERAAQAGLNLARAQAAPGLTVSAKYSSDTGITDPPAPFTPVPDQSRRLSFGVSVELPLFKRNQGTIAEAATAISQARARREFAEQVVRNEVTSAYARYQAAQAAQRLFEQGVLMESNANISTLSEAYRMGAFRITELIAEQRRLVDSQREYTEVLTERYRALADLHTAIGAPAQ
ncbi:MAG: TolC family protein [Blastocatellia bacterium]|nr:TolC family protein [Blastocatellia bacterium]